MHKRIRLILLAVIVLLGIAIVLQSVRQSHQRNAQKRLAAVAGQELTEVLSRWNQAGRPEGDALSEFLRTGPHETVASNLLLTFDGKNYYTQFAMTRLGFPGTLFITTNRELVLVRDNRAPALISSP